MAVKPPSSKKLRNLAWQTDRGGGKKPNLADQIGEARLGIMEEFLPEIPKSQNGLMFGVLNFYNNDARVSELVTLWVGKIMKGPLNRQAKEFLNFLNYFSQLVI